MVDPVVVVLAAIIGVLGLVTVFAKNPISSAFSLVMLMVALAGVYAMIGAHFIAALQAIVYAGAVMVLFVFSIMLLNLNEEKAEVRFNSPLTWVSIALTAVLLLLLEIAFTSWSSETNLPPVGNMNLENIRALGGNVVAVSGSLFSQAYIQFEFISLLLLVAIASALVLAKRKVD